MERIISLLIGYLLGNFMTAEFVTRRLTGKPCSELGTTGNPGMANVMANLGFKAGISVLIGDLAKCAAACGISYLLFGESSGNIVVLYAGIGATLGHDFPVFMNRGKGGKGVAVSCLAIFLFSPLWGLLANIFGMLVTFATKYLCIGGAALPAFYVIPMFLFYGPEEGFLSLGLALLCLYKHWSVIRKIPTGEAEKTDVLGAIRKKFSRSNMN